MLGLTKMLAIQDNAGRFYRSVQFTGISMETHSQQGAKVYKLRRLDSHSQSMVMGLCHIEGAESTIWFSIAYDIPAS